MTTTETEAPRLEYSTPTVHNPTTRTCCVSKCDQVSKLTIYSAYQPYGVCNNFDHFVETAEIIRDFDEGSKRRR